MGLTLAELAQPCHRCDHQAAVHTGGADRFGWAIYDRTWAEASGWCSTPGCACPGRLNRLARLSRGTS